MKPASAKNKGRKLQKHVVKMILEIFPELEEDDVVSRPMGSPGEDILLSPKARKLLGGIGIECKNTKKFPGLEALRQIPDREQIALGVVVWHPPRVNYDESIAIVRLKDLLEWLRRMISGEDH